MPERSDLLLTPLVGVSVASIYKGHLPARMARCTPDTAAALEGLVGDLRALGHELRLSDLFRSYAMQKQAHQDYLRGRKQAYSPPPGSSMHEAGRAMDIDLSSMGVPLARFWEIAAAHGFYPVIDQPIPSRSEAWHFDRRGSHHAVYEYVRGGKAGAAFSPYTQMARSAILATGVSVDCLPRQDTAFLQSALIRLGYDPGRIDGVLGERTRAALRAAGCLEAEQASALVSERLREAFPLEYAPGPPMLR